MLKLLVGAILATVAVAAEHVPRSVTAREASDAGQKSIEHLNESQLLIDCSSEEAGLRAGKGGLQQYLDTYDAQHPELRAMLASAEAAAASRQAGGEIDKHMSPHSFCSLRLCVPALNSYC